MNKMEARWKEGIFIGVDKRSGELIMAHCEGTSMPAANPKSGAKTSERTFIGVAYALAA